MIRRIYLTSGQVSSVAVSPDGNKLYVGTSAAGSFRLLVYNLVTVRPASSKMTVSSTGDLVATSGGVWGTAGTGTSEWAWFAQKAT